MISHVCKHITFFCALSSTHSHLSCSHTLSYKSQSHLFYNSSLNVKRYSISTLVTLTSGHLDTQRPSCSLLLRSFTMSLTSCPATTQLLHRVPWTSSATTTRINNGPFSRWLTLSRCNRCNTSNPHMRSATPATLDISHCCRIGNQYIPWCHSLSHYGPLKQTLIHWLHSTLKHLRNCIAQFELHHNGAGLLDVLVSQTFSAPIPNPVASPLLSQCIISLSFGELSLPRHWLLIITLTMHSSIMSLSTCCLTTLTSHRPMYWYVRSIHEQNSYFCCILGDTGRGGGSDVVNSYNSVILFIV